jgi:membrane-associated protease RseP (regulator of RpoE activity)
MNDFEIREYVPLVLAVVETEVDTKNVNSGDNTLFFILAAYIGVRGQARNSTQRNIAMTAPVLSEFVVIYPGRLKKRMAFILPKYYKTVAAAPVPTDKRVTLVEVPALLVAAFRFSGDATYTQCRSIALRLLRNIDDTRYEPAITSPLQPRPPGLGVVLEGRAVVRVVPGSAAERAGLRVGDELTAADGRVVAAAADLASVLQDRAGSPVAVRILRGGSAMELVADLGAAAMTAPVGQEGGWLLGRYDPPMVPPPLRTNDVMVLLRSPPPPTSLTVSAPAVGAGPPASLAGPAAPEPVRAELAAAVRAGAPLYNAGDAAGCAAASHPPACPPPAAAAASTRALAAPPSIAAC